MVRVRIAPSPTGDPHIGTAYIALFNYVFARKHGGRFLLRIEDTDQARTRPGAEAAILRSLRWLGLAWDEGPDVGGPHGPYRQSERAALYREHARGLVESGAAYRCFCSAERLEAMRKARAGEGLPPGYDRRCRGIAAAEARARAEAGEPHVVRLAMPVEGVTVVRDRLRGEIATENARVDDQVLLKSDGLPTYHLANVVDDRLMGITHVIRAEEWLPSTPKHLRLYQAFGWPAPEWIHMPLLRNADKSKISKRRNPVSIDFYREYGVLPEGLRNYLALMGWSFGGDREKFTLDEMIAAFDIDRVGAGAPVFDLDKLCWLNGLYLRELPAAEVVARLRAWRLGDDTLLALVPLLGERFRVLSEFVPLAGFCLRGEIELAPAAADLVPKGRAAADTAKMIEELLERIDAHDEFAPGPLEALFRAFCERSGWKTKEVFMTVRAAVTGTRASPPLFDTLVAVGRESARYRLRRAAAFLRALKP